MPCCSSLPSTGFSPQAAIRQKPTNTEVVWGSKLRELGNMDCWAKPNLLKRLDVWRWRGFQGWESVWIFKKKCSYVECWKGAGFMVKHFLYNSIQVMSTERGTECVWDVAFVPKSCFILSFHPHTSFSAAPLKIIWDAVIVNVVMMSVGMWWACKDVSEHAIKVVLW